MVGETYKERMMRKRRDYLKGKAENFCLREAKEMEKKRFFFFWVWCCCCHLFLIWLLMLLLINYNFFLKG